MAIFDLLLCIPPTSVKCETTFLQMKFIKTSRRTKLKPSTLNDLLTVKIESSRVEEYDPESALNVWPAIQKRVSGSLRFDRNWTEYKNGFGSPEQDVWIGNDVIHQLTKRKDCSLYVSITLVNGTRLYQLYDGFTVSDESENYKLSLKGATRGTVGDSIRNTYIPAFNVPGMYFSTLDRDNDRLGGDSCAVYNGGGWWFNACHQAFLNDPWASPDWSYVWDPYISRTGQK
ncbi:fibroleukin-like [Saccostrea echinata]|uniref:fibroleukin-like n=1 Tax=Saccostrea echinata TaxID=191078 RepID=UPI002A82BA48|nr:fibroleukin-like [Saccostrea echinata]